MTKFQFSVSKVNMHWNKSGLHYTLDSKVGPVGRNIYQRGRSILRGARTQVGVDTGALKASLRIAHDRDARGGFIKVGSPLNYALMHHEGTKPHIITPNRSQYLVFNKGGRVIYATSVRHPGTKPNRYLTDNIYLARG